MNRLGIWPRTLLMALCAVAGIVGMLLSVGMSDMVFFALTALPLVAGGWYAWKWRASGKPAIGRDRSVL